jgi:hypothetical protein
MHGFENIAGNAERTEGAMFARQRNVQVVAVPRSGFSRVVVCLVLLTLLFVLAVGGVAWAKVHEWSSGEITPATSTATAGSDLRVLTVTLVDKHGNPLSGVAVEGDMQGGGLFKPDSPDDLTDASNPAMNHDYDITDAQGQAKVYAKSYVEGEQLIHLKYRGLTNKDKPGLEPYWFTLDATVTWLCPSS